MDPSNNEFTILIKDNIITTVHVFDPEIDKRFFTTFLLKMEKSKELFTENSIYFLLQFHACTSNI